MAGLTAETTLKALDDAYAAAVASAFGALVMRISGSGGETPDAECVAAFKKQMRIIKAACTIAYGDPSQ
jgi:hypothetical protein